jgi:ATP-dependent helicase HrpA
MLNPMSIRYPADLPITARREEIVGAIRGNQVLILAGETGSGKTTQLPKMCLEAAGEDLKGQIGCTQPRRVAAMSVSRRVAEELGVVWGREVGCKMRFSDDTSRETRVKFMTDGILLAEIQSDPMLRQYSMIILDEAHERSLNIDFLLGYLKELLPRRPDLKVIVTSATIDTEAFAAHFGGAPIIEVSGRLYPVEVRYRPVAEDDDEPHFIDAAVAAAEDALIETEAGDVLIFMPTERDIRETRDLLDGRLAGSRIEVLALFGRQSSAEQQRIFSPGAKRRVVIATNVAETSITIPRIRVVIDTGLARMSRYNPRTRTKRLPVEAVSQSSANQRAGRAGRVQDGVCIRLFEQEDFEKRAKFTMPEIQRANLAEVILRMKAHGLGEIEVFPFLNPPSHAAIRGGYELLHELGALNDLHELTGTGRELAKLPLDPSLGRMLLQARKEGCLEEMLIIASGLSVPDPRERPEEKREAANAAHKAFNTPDSDFLSLLKIWRAVPEGGGKNQLGKFCKANFLSFTRMQEWRDIWKQLREGFGNEGVREGERGGGNDEEAMNGKTGVIHRCILAAHLGQIGMRIERNVYKAGGNREVMVFPGSVFYERREKNDKKGQEITKQPLWVVAGEIVQTSQLFARTLAKVDPEWIAELGAHLCDYKYSEPHWSAKAGRVLVTRRTLVHGLEVRRDKIDYGKIDAVGATQLFIRGALIEGENALTHRFYQNNQRIRQKIETTLTRVRSSRVHDVEEALFAFYDARIAEVSSIHDLNALIQEHGDQFLHLAEEDLTPGDDLGADLKLFPDEVALGNSVLPVSYHYKPGEEHDGVTVQVPLPVAEHLTTGQIQWMVPGLREELCRTLLRALPRAIRKQLMPIEPKAAEVAARFEPGRAEFLPALAAYLKKTYRVEVAGSDWPVDCVPVHLQPRIEVVDQKQRTVVAARDLGAIQSAVKQTEVKSDAWEKLVPRFERYDLKGWTFGDVPEWVVVEHIGGAEVRGYPGLERDKDGLVNLRLFRRAEEAVRGTPGAVRRLAELTLGKDIAWLAKELRGFAPVSAGPKAAASFAGALNQLQTQVVAVKAAGVGLPEQAQEHVLAHLLRLEPVLPLTEKRFEGLLEKVRKELPLVTQRTRDLFKQVHEQREQITRGSNRYPGMEADLARLVPGDLLLTTPHGQLPQVLRYLKAVRIRAERAGNNPAKDADKAQLIAEWDGWETFVPAANREVFRWLMEEYRVQVFAQELGTAQAVSVKRLEALL